LSDDRERHESADLGEDEPGAGRPAVPGRSGAKLDGINRDPRTTFIVNCVIVLTLLVGIPGAIVAVVALRGGSSEALPPAPQVSASEPTRPRQSPHLSESGVSSTPPGRDDVTCLDTDRGAVPCGDLHKFEVIALDRMPRSACDDKAVMTYLGGVVGLDVISAGVHVESAEQACTIEAPESQSEPFEAVLGTARQAAWRSCRNDERQADVGCSDPHTGEYVGGTSLGDASAEECAQAVAKYVRAPFSLIDDRVTWRRVVDAADNSTAARCVIVARGQGLGIPVVLRNVEDLQFELVPLR
jgi:hypothetical protein